MMWKSEYTQGIHTLTVENSVLKMECIVTNTAPYTCEYTLGDPI